MKLLLNFLLFSSAIVHDSFESCDDILVSEFSPTDCIAKQTVVDSYYYWQSEANNCLPTCKKYNPDGHFRDSCSTEPCPPPYTCSKRCSRLAENAKIPCQTNEDCTKAGAVRATCVDMCVVSDHSCMAYHANTSDFRDYEFSAQKFKPTCTKEGGWAGKQCKGGVSGKCYCYDSKGDQLFGQALYQKAADMTCACSRRRAELEASGRPYVSLHCDGQGNFEKLQCDSGLCWCAESRTGRLLSAVVPEKAMPRLPCYDPVAVGSQYLRQCDSRQYAVAKITSTLKRHGVEFANLAGTLCDGDGAYGVYQFSGGIAYCTWRDGAKIGTWQSESSSDIGSLTCKCARDYKMYGHLLRCSGNGNYDPVQDFVLDGKNYYYCVDVDGFSITNYFTERIGNCSSYY